MCIKPTFSGREEKLRQKWRCINHPEIVCWGKAVLQRWFSGWVIVSELCFCFSHKPTFGVTGVFINLKIWGKLLSTYWNLKSHIKKDKFSSDPSKSLYARKPFQSAMNGNLKGHTESWSGKCLMYLLNQSNQMITFNFFCSASLQHIIEVFNNAEILCCFKFTFFHDRNVM